MTEAIQHRGPDSSDHWVDPDSGVALGHRRLAIVDLSAAGAQPMHSASGRYIITFNGEIYNHQELRSSLLEAGVRFRGGSDTEVLLALIEREGLRSALRRCRGMFALGIWDRQDKTLSLARDRMGEKPLYIQTGTKGFRFASELKALTAGQAKGSLEIAAIGDVLERGYIRGQRTILRDVRKLPPACIATVRQAGSSFDVGIEHYWSLESAALEDRFRLSEPEAIQEFQALLDKVVRDESLADVPLGAFLSGGIDSSLIVATMQRVSAGAVRTFTIAFDEAEFDESAHARSIAEHLDTQHEEIRLTARDALQFVDRLPDLYDEPFADSSQLPTLLICQATRRHVTVALSGDGGDELFGGYGQYLGTDRMAEALAAWPTPLRPVAEKLAGVAAGRFAQSPGQQDRLTRASILLGNRDRRTAHETLLSAWPAAQRVLAPSLVSELRPQMQASLPGWPAVPDDVLARQVYDAMTYLPDDILVKVDRAAMAFSLETRAPLLDHLIVEFAMRLPIEFKIRNGEGKQLLRKALGQLIPRELFERPKRGFAIPLNQWLRTELREWGNQLLEDDRLVRMVFRPDIVRRVWTRHQSGENHGAKLWRVLVILQWLRHHSYQEGI